MDDGFIIGWKLIETHELSPSSFFTEVGSQLSAIGSCKIPMFPASIFREVLEEVIEDGLMVPGTEDHDRESVTQFFEDLGLFGGDVLIWLSKRPVYIECKNITSTDMIADNVIFCLRVIDTVHREKV